MRLTSITLRVADLARSRRFYEQTLGLKLKVAFPGMAVLEAGYVTITLSQHGAAAAGVKIAPSAGLLAETELSLEVPDVHGAYRDLHGRGVKFESEPRAISGDSTRQLLGARFRDPDGHFLSLTGWTIS